MKRIAVIIGIAVAMMGCTHACVQPVSLRSTSDSVNYALGYLHGWLSYRMIGADSTKQASKTFLHTFDRVAAGQGGKESGAFRSGHLWGLGLIDFETRGLNGYTLWPLNEPLVLQGFVSGYYGDTILMTRQGVEHAQQRANQSIHTQAWKTVYPQVRAKQCPSQPSSVSMENLVDTLNYAFGWSHGTRFAHFSGKDSTFRFEDCIRGINQALREHPHQPGAVAAAEKLALQAHRWTTSGLDGNNFPYQPAIYRQALADGLRRDTTTLRFKQAKTYLMDNLPAVVPMSLKRH